MKVLVGLVVAAMLTVGVVYVLSTGSRQHRACERIADVCDVELTSYEIDRCTSQLETRVSPVASQEISTCVLEAKDCFNAILCTRDVTRIGIDVELRRAEKAAERLRR